jgi:hypothetical protein
MKNIITMVAFSVGLIYGVAKADNPLAQDQLLKAVQSSSADYANIEPSMTKSVSGFKVTTLGNNAQVIIYMDADGMNMTAKYLCVPQGENMACHFQQ